MTSGISKGELKFDSKMKEKGWRTLEKGWPDRICYRVDSKGNMCVLFVEIKGGYNLLSKSQRETISLLTKLGLSCFVYVERFDRFVPFKKYLKEQNKTAGESNSEHMKRRWQEGVYRNRAAVHCLHKVNCQCCVCRARRGEYKGKGHPRYGTGIGMVERECEYCETVFSVALTVVRRGDGRFHSVSCARKAQRVGIYGGI